MTRRRFVEPWPWALAGILGVSAAVLATFWALAASHPDPVVGDAYAAGLRYNEDLRARRRAESLGVDLRVEVARAPGGVRVLASLVGPDGASVRPERVTVRRVRPAEGGLDREFRLRAEGAGFAREVPLPLPGRWELWVTATIDGAPLQRVVALRAGPS